MRATHANLFDPSDTTTQSLRSAFESWMGLALERAAAHVHDPQRYPLPPDADSMEALLHGWLAGLPDGDRRRMVDRVVGSIQAPAAQRRQRWGRLADVDLAQPADVLTQAVRAGLLDDVKPSPAFKARLAALATATPRAHGNGEDGSGGSHSGPAHEKHVPQLQLCLRSLECLKDTREAGRDEMYVMGTAVDGISALRNFGPIRLGKYRAEYDNERREERHDRRDERREERRENRNDRHPSRELRGKTDNDETHVRRDFQQPFALVSFPTKDTGFARNFEVILMLYERDLGFGAPEKALDSLLSGVASPLSKMVYDKIKKEIAGAMTAGTGTFGALFTAALMGGATVAGAAAAAATPALIAGLAALAVFGLITALRKAFAPEVFELVHANIVLEDLHGLIDADDFHTDAVTAEVAQVALAPDRAGKYRLTYEWKLIP